MEPASYILIPGAGGGPWVWHLVREELARRGHDAVAVDLPGEDDSAGLPEYTDAVVDAAGGRTGSILVGHSMGAYAATLACAKLRPRMLVLLNAMIPAPGESAGEWWGNTGHDEAMRDSDLRAGRDPDAGFDPFVYFLHDLPRQLIEESAAHARDQSETPFGQPWPLATWPDVPTSALLGRDDRFFPAEFQRRVAAERLGSTPDEVPGGHLAALGYPREVTDRLETFARET